FHVDGIRSKVLFPFYLIHLKTHRLISLRIPDYSCTHYLTNSLTILYSFSHLLKYDIIKVSNCAWDGAFLCLFLNTTAFQKFFKRFFINAKLSPELINFDKKMAV